MPDWAFDDPDDDIQPPSAPAKTSASPSLPALKGSAKQVKWAETLRADLLERAQDKAAHDPQFRPTLEAMRKIEEASWWISTRNCALERVTAPTSPSGAAEEALLPTFRPPPSKRPTAPPASRPRSSARPAVEAVRPGFDASVTFDGRLYVLEVTFDGHSSGILRLTRAEMEKLHQVLGSEL